MNAERALAEIANMNDRWSGNSALDGDELLEAATALAAEVQRLRVLGLDATERLITLEDAARELALVASDACEHIDDDLSTDDGREGYAVKVRLREANSAVRKALRKP